LWEVRYKKVTSQKSLGKWKEGHRGKSKGSQKGRKTKRPLTPGDHKKRKKSEKKKTTGGEGIIRSWGAGVVGGRWKVEKRGGGR